MRVSSIFRLVLALIAISVGLSFSAICARGQAVGADVGGGAGIFRPKNPEAKKRTTRPAPVTRRGSAARTSAAAAAAAAANLEDRIEDLLDKGNQFRDVRRFAEA